MGTNESQAVLHAHHLACSLCCPAMVNREMLKSAAVTVDLPIGPVPFSPVIFATLAERHVLIQLICLVCGLWLMGLVWSFFKIQFLYTAPAVLKLPTQTRLVSNSQKSTLCLLSATIKGMHHGRPAAPCA